MQAATAAALLSAVRDASCQVCCDDTCSCALSGERRQAQLLRAAHIPRELRDACSCKLCTFAQSMCAHCTHPVRALLQPLENGPHPLLMPAPPRTRPHPTHPQVVLALLEGQWSSTQLSSVPLGVALPLQEALQRCRADPPQGTRGR